MVNSMNPQQYNIPMQAINGQVLPVNIDKEKIKEGVDNSYLANRVKASQDEQTNPLLYAGTGAAIWYGIAQGMDVFNRSCGKDYEKTAFGKLGAWGDKIATAWNKTALGKLFNGAGRKAKDLGHWMTEKNSLAYSLANHSTNPEWHFAKTPGAGVHGFLAMDMQQVFDEYLKPISKNSNKFSWIGGKNVNPQRLEQYGLKQADIDAFKNTLKGKTYAEKALAIQKKELELLGVNPSRLAKCNNLAALERLAYAKKVRKLGFKSVAEYNTIKADILAHPDKVMEILERATKNGDIVVPIWRKSGGLGKIQNHLFGRQVSLKEYLNKYKAALGKGNKTALGRFLPKALSWLLEGCTNRFAGGKIAVAMQAGIFADMLIHTFKAPKGEKGKTLAERFVNDFTYFMAMPLGIIAMHKVGGLKYAGMTTEQVKAYRAALKQFNEDVKSGLLSDKQTYKNRAKDLKKMLKADVKNPITKLFKKLGGLINIGNETKLARRSSAKWNLNLLRKSGNLFRNLAGVPLRIAIPLAIVSPFLAKLTTKGAHAIFGKPTKSVLDEGKEEEQAQELQTQEQQKAMQEALLKAAQAQAAAKSQAPHVPQSQTNLINQYVNAQKNQPSNTNSNLINQTITNAQQASITNRPNVKNAADKLPASTALKRSYVPSPECGIPTEVKKPKYIPSPESVVSAGPAEDYSAAEMALSKADQAEKNVMETLGMRW
ncbi:hypothetical protein DBY21_10635 [Candidatus Gastranaerophilales bacterium]|nr:MAG: hypothetical protein DBY21_10635 [Candidatus Gastranaerophilales bacterium]